MAWHYSPDDQNLTVGGNPIKGFARGSFIKISQAEEAGGTREGIGGEVTFVHKKTKRYTLECTLDYGSASNDYLAGIYIANQKLPGAGVVPIKEKDALGREFFVSAEAAIRNLPEVSKEAEQGADKVWIFDCVVEPGGFFPGGL